MTEVWREGIKTEFLSTLEYRSYHTASSILKLITNRLDYLLLIGYHPDILQNDPLGMNPILYHLSTPIGSAGEGPKEA